MTPGYQIDAVLLAETRRHAYRAFAAPIKERTVAKAPAGAFPAVIDTIALPEARQNLTV
jgi:hypothetical protein